MFLRCDQLNFRCVRFFLKIKHGGIVTLGPLFYIEMNSLKFKVKWALREDC